MTSPQTDADTRAAFEANSFYGLDPADVVFFQQGTLPCFTHDGKILMETGSKVSCAPDGNGGIYHGLVVRNFVMHTVDMPGVELP
jgi:UDP-N-acetylglucosamine/UDP-N-acetylgalactosamine diphosphorylase